MDRPNRHWTYWLGLLLALVAAGITWEGTAFGDSTVPIAITVLIVGIALIATSRRR
ncbi:MAG TPA: hypothetical protein VJ898_03555 [Natrialbaceae archaeon]|nr:hypothetical protein [Natrialbaceae archaeon]